MAEDWENAGRWVQQGRTSRRWSIRTAAKNAGVSTSTWFNIEHGERIDQIRQAAIGEALEWPADAWRRVLDGLPPTADDDVPPRPSSHITDRDYNSDIAELPSDAQAIIDSIIDREIKKQQS